MGMTREAGHTGSFSHKYAQRVLNILYDFCKSSTSTSTSTSNSNGRPRPDLAKRQSRAQTLLGYLLNKRTTFGPNAFVHQLSCLSDVLWPPILLHVLPSQPQLHIHEREGAMPWRKRWVVDGGHRELETHAMACKLCVGQKLKYGVATQAN